MKNQYYHVYNRGFIKMKIFRSNNDCKRFLENIKKYSRKYRVKILSHALMENHFHFLLMQDEIDGIVKFMQKLQQAYSMYFNVKHDRRGAVFNGRFKAKPVHDYEYFEDLKHYISTNLIKEAIKTGEIRSPNNMDMSSSLQLSSNFPDNPPD